MGKRSRIVNRAARAALVDPYFPESKAIKAIQARAALPQRTVVVAAGYPDEWRSRLRTVTRRITRDRESQRQLVAQALAAGATWSAIAEVLEVTRQTAHQRFRHLTPNVDSRG